jgi:hypothetical protein
MKEKGHVECKDIEDLRHSLPIKQNFLGNPFGILSPALHHRSGSVE